MYGHSPSPVTRVFTPPRSSSPSVRLVGRVESSPRTPLSTSSSFDRSDSTRFAPNTFQYNGRVAASLLPCVIVLLGAGGTPVLATLLAGLMLSYILDALQLKNGAFLGVWGSFFATGVALIVTGIGSGPHIPPILSGLIVLTSLHVVFLCGVWTSLQFKWLQLEHPVVVVALERILFACCPLTSAAVQTWGVVAAVGIAYAPFYLMPIQFILYWLFSIPQLSSFRNKNDRSLGGGQLGDGGILGPLEACIHTLVLLFLPPFFNFAVHHSMALHSLNEVCNHLLLFFLPLLFQLFASTRGALWWIFEDQRQIRQIRIVNGAVALAVVLACLEVRVIFTSFGHYIQLRAPFNYILVTVALYGGGFGAAAHVLGLLRGAIGKVMVSVVLVASAVSGSIVLGMPLKIIPAPAIGAVYLAQYYSSGGAPSYFIFLLSATLSAAWFILHNFWFLDVSLGGMPIKTICGLLLGSLVLALAVPGVTLLPRASFLVGVAFIAQAFLVCRLENRFYNLGHDEEGLYPSYLVVLTTIAGFVAARRLEADRKMGPWAAWIGSCLYLAKLPMLLVASDDVVWASAILMLAITPPLLLYKDKAKGGTRMKSWQGFAHIATIMVAVWLCRFTLFDALLWWSGRRPSHSLLLGLLLLACVTACLPIITNHFPHVQASRRAAVLVVAASLLFIALQPPVPVGGHLLWDDKHMPDTEPDDSTIYGSTVHSPSWSAWLLWASLLATLAAATSALPVTQVSTIRLAYALGIGTSGGIYLCVQYFADSPLAHFFIITATICAAIFLVFTHQPSDWSPRVLPAVYGVLVFLLPIVWSALGFGKNTIDSESENYNYYDDLAITEARNSLFGMYCALLLLIALVIKLKLSSLLRNKNSGGPPVSLPNHSPFTPKHRTTQRRPDFLKSFAIKKMMVEGAWLPVIGNISTLLCFCLALYINKSMTENSDKSIFAIAPILLLLNQDANLLTSFTDRQRYFPLTVVVSLFLLVCSLWRIYDDGWFNYQNEGWQFNHETGGVFYLLKNVALVVLSLPSHVVFNKFMWDYVRQSDYLLLVITPLNLPGLLLPDVLIIRSVAGVGFLYAVAQYFISRHVRIAGMRYI